MTEAMQTDIDQVIARSRQPGGFSERKRFSVARQRAIQKMREFALSDPYHYVLELIQAAVANQATHVDLQISSRDFVLSYVGGGFAEFELTQLFDYLFASKQDFAHSDLRQLAVGVNALMFFEPELIVIESGQGTLETTTRIEIRHKEDTVDVGTPEQPLHGTFVRAQGLKRSRADGKSQLDTIGGGLPEAAAITDRCLCAPIPIILNHQPIFGYSSLRIPVLYGYDSVVSFDEGDLYGAIGLARHEHNSFFKLLTWGTWVQSVAHEMIPQIPMGGIVAFDRLNKTADHAAIVRDERLEELWARLSPYAEMARLGTNAGAALQLRSLDGVQLSLAEVRQLIDTSDTIVAVPAELSAESVGAWRAQRIAQLLGAPVLMGRKKDIEMLGRMAGSRARVLRPDLDGDASLAFFEQPPAQPPPRPWLAAPYPIDPVGLDELVAAMPAAASSDAGRDFWPFWNEITRAHGSEKPMCQATIFSPQSTAAGGEAAPSQPGQGLFARVKSVDRVIWQGPIDSPYPGFWLDIDVGVTAPNALLGSANRRHQKTAAECIAQAMASRCSGDFKRLTHQILQSVAREHFTPSSPAAQAARAALARDTILRLRKDPAEPSAARIEFSLLGTQQRQDLLELALFTTLDGQALSLRDIEALMAQTGGLIYGTIPEVEADLEGLNRARILALDAETEALLIQIVGQGAYVRVDQRDILARTSDARWQVRDLAVGLRAYPDCDLLVEGPAAAAGAVPEEAEIQALVQMLSDGVRRARAPLAQALGDAFSRRHQRPPAPTLSRQQMHFNILEAGRQAARHLRYFVCRRLARRLEPGAPQLPTYGVEELGLFVDASARMVSLAQIVDGFDAHGQLVMLDGRASDVIGFDEPLPADGVLQALMLNPWSFHLLRPFGRLVGALDLDFTLEAPNPAAGLEASKFLVRQPVEAPGISGEIGFPVTAPEQPAIAVVSNDRQRVFALRGVATQYGVVGTLIFQEDTALKALRPSTAEQDWARLEQVAEDAALQVMAKLLTRLLETPAGQEDARILQALLALVSRHVQVVRESSGLVRCRISATREQERALVKDFLKAPLFPTRRGVPVGAGRLIEQFCVEQTRAVTTDAGWRLELAPDATPTLTAWLATMTDPARLVTSAPRTLSHTVPPAVLEPSAGASPPPRAPANAADPGAPDTSPEQELCARLERLLFALRPDGRIGDAGPRRSFQGPSNWTQVVLVDSQELERAGFFGWRAQREGAPEAIVYRAGAPSVVSLSRQHWLVTRALEAPADDPTPVVWLLLAIYGHINALLPLVTNEHELEFQRNLVAALQTGALW